LTKGLYFATPVPWSKNRSGLNVRHKPHHSSPAVKAVNAALANAARSSRGTRGRESGGRGLPNIAVAVGNKLRGQRYGGGARRTEAQMI